MANGPKGRWEIQAVGPCPAKPRRGTPARWRSYDLRGPLSLKTTLALAIAIHSLPSNLPWPEIDEEAWWRDVLSDARVRTPTMKHLPLDGWRSKFRLDRHQCLSITFTCNQCRQQTTVSVADLIKEFGSGRNVTSIGNDMLKCLNKRARREGYDCPITLTKGLRS